MPFFESCEAQGLRRTRLLLGEDDPAILDTYAAKIEREGFDVLRARHRQELTFLAEEAAPDIVVLGWVGVSGAELCRTLRAAPASAEVPIIILGEPGDTADRVRALESGADIYLAKPLTVLELVAHAQAVLRRVRPALVDARLTFRDLEMDVSRYKVRRSGVTIPLTPAEFRLLRHFLEYPGRVFSRERLMQVACRHDAMVDPRTIDVYVRRLRKAINIGPSRNLIRTVRSAGYALDDDQEEYS